MSSRLQPTWFGDSQYAVLIRVPYQQCTDQSSLDSVFNTNKVKNAFNDFKTSSNQRFYEVIINSVSFTAAKPMYESTNSKENDHAEYILIYATGTRNKSPLQTILDMVNDDQCVVLYTYYSPCITKCINDPNYNILDGLSNWKNEQTTGIKAFVFQEIWHKDSTGVPQDQEEQFTKINNRVPLYRCAKYNHQMQCFKCGNAGSETLHPNCVSWRSISCQ